MNTEIKPAVVKELRKRKEWSREKLAQESNISPRQIARIEGCQDASMTVREHTVNQLAKALKLSLMCWKGKSSFLSNIYSHQKQSLIHAFNLNLTSFTPVILFLLTN